MYVYFLLSVLFYVNICNCVEEAPSQQTPEVTVPVDQACVTEAGEMQDFTLRDLSVGQAGEVLSIEDILNKLNFLRGNRSQIEYLLNYLYLNRELLQIYIAEKLASHVNRDIEDFDNVEIKITKAISEVRRELSPDSFKIVQNVDTFLQSQNSLMRLDLLGNLFKLRAALAKCWTQMHDEVKKTFKLVDEEMVSERDIAFTMVAKFKELKIFKEHNYFWYAAVFAYMDALVIDKMDDHKFYPFLCNIVSMLDSSREAINASRAKNELQNLLNYWRDFQRLFAASKQIEDLIIKFGEEIFSKMSLFEETYNKVFLAIQRLTPKDQYVKILYGPDAGGLIKPNFWVVSGESICDELNVTTIGLEVSNLLTAGITPAFEAYNYTALSACFDSPSKIKMLRQLQRPSGYLSRFYVEFSKDGVKILGAQKYFFEFGVDNELFKKFSGEISSICVPRYMIKSFLEYKKRYLSNLAAEFERLKKKKTDLADAAVKDLMQSGTKRSDGKTKSKVELPSKRKGRRSDVQQAQDLQQTRTGGTISKKSKNVTASEATVMESTDDEVGWTKVQEKKEERTPVNIQINIVMRQIENALYDAKPHEFIVDKDVAQKYIIFHDDWGEGPRDGCTLIVYQNFSNNFNIEPFTFMVKGHVDIKHLIPEFMYSRLKYGILVKPGSAAHAAFNTVAINHLWFEQADMVAIVLKSIILPKGMHELYKDKSDTEIMNLIKHELLVPGRKGAFVFIFDPRRNICFHQMFHEFSQDINHGNPKLVHINPTLGYC